jgi:hypothetical protein
MNVFDWVIGFRPAPSPASLGLLIVATLTLLASRWSGAQAEAQRQPEGSSPRQAEPVAILERRPGLPVLPTIEVPRDRQTVISRMVDASLSSREEQGTWVLDFAYKPLRIKTADLPGRGKRKIYYLYYRVINRSGAPRRFAPQFIMVNDKGEKFEASIVPEAVAAIQMREDATIPVLGRARTMGILPPSTKPDVDDAVYGVVTWDNWDQNADRFSIYIRGLSGGYQVIEAPSRGKRSVQQKSLKIDFIRQRGQRNIHQREIQLADPPHEWVYW